MKRLFNYVLFIILSSNFYPYVYADCNADAAKIIDEISNNGGHVHIGHLYFWNFNPKTKTNTDSNGIKYCVGEANYHIANPDRYFCVAWIIGDFKNTVGWDDHCKNVILE